MSDGWHGWAKRLQLLDKSMTWEESLKKNNTLLVEYGILSDRVLASMWDQASTNEVAVITMTILYPNILDIGWFSHTIDNAGGHFQTQTLRLEEFIKLWISLFSHSPWTRLEWKDGVGGRFATKLFFVNLERFYPFFRLTRRYLQPIQESFHSCWAILKRRLICRLN